MTLEQLLESYDQDHQHPANRALHLLGITLIGSSVIVVFLAPPVGVALFGLGWSAQFLGHAIEGKPPSFTRHPRYMAIGAVWYARELRRVIGTIQVHAKPPRRTRSEATAELS